MLLTQLDGSVRETQQQDGTSRLSPRMMIPPYTPQPTLAQWLAPNQLTLRAARPSGRGRPIIIDPIPPPREVSFPGARDRTGPDCVALAGGGVVRLGAACHPGSSLADVDDPSPSLTRLATLTFVASRVRELGETGRFSTQRTLGLPAVHVACV